MINGLTKAQLAKKLPTFTEAESRPTCSEESASEPNTETRQYAPHTHCFLRFIFILHSHLCTGFTFNTSPLGFTSEIVYALRLSYILSLLYLIGPTISVGSLVSGTQFMQFITSLQTVVTLLSAFQTNIPSEINSKCTFCVFNL